MSDQQDPPVTRPTKAIVAGVVAFTATLATAAADNAVTWGELALVAAGTAAAVGAVYGVTNRPVS